ncbi:MAG: PriCT-2 domain-containing protein [Halieaceae bacterium]
MSKATTNCARSTKDRDPNDLTSAQIAFILCTLGFYVIPIFPGGKIPAWKWRANRRGGFPSRRALMRHWRKHPDHDVAIVVGPHIIVLDADTPEAEARLHEIEEAHGICPNVTVRTRKGVHHYFALTEGTTAIADGLDSKTNPTGIDIRTGETLAIVPPSTDKSFEICEAVSLEELVSAGQDFVDALDRNNGREPASSTRMATALSAIGPEDLTVQSMADKAKIKELLSHIDPDLGYRDWIQIGMALHHATGGTQDGLGLFDHWSSGGSKYKGREDIERTWNYLRIDHDNPITLGTLVMMSNQAKQPLLLPAPPSPVIPSSGSTSEHELLCYSLRGQSDQLSDLLEDQTFILDEIAIGGQWTVIYAPPNTGKTLITLYQLLHSIKSKTLNPEKLFYVNADDNFRGLTEKLAIAEEFGFHMLAPGHAGFRTSMLVPLLGKMVESGNASGTVIVLDTLKKFVDLMDKGKCTAFGTAVRPYTLQGGTLLCLAHVNKHRDKGGKAIYGGVSDNLDDADCGYKLHVTDNGDNRRTVRFENKKARGNVADSLVYSYRTEREIAYRELLDSVQRVGDQALKEILDRSNGDADIIDSVRRAIADGPITSTTLLATVKSSVDASRRKIEQVLNNHTIGSGGDDLWECNRGKHNARLYSLPAPPTPESDT